eukprot:CAMPEP_0183315158 /NCGR_PEP_ID=MMETSP0160_2-20130417/50819_1 /TAXON_ID=2839 ORGANISM="Odontella Sinensis, Strain Grunow 1884" /NCGR_SAMPLE_ID=MMETSP0160_2 /ASSEMBLY_ACC=CAM_ASM_000250 /LENGTH=61 /DNA_ID=CAMNT_0025480659 /DNA_START=776 /DNA_END=961 /DNA_ORIENTATION=+
MAELEHASIRVPSSNQLGLSHCPTHGRGFLGAVSICDGSNGTADTAAVPPFNAPIAPPMLK